jgi:Flp pilus assembly protein TadD
MTETLYHAYQEAQSLLQSRDPLGALRVLEPVIDEAEGKASVHLLAGRAYFLSAQLGRAQAAFERVIDIDPSDHYAHYALGRTLERLQRKAEAATHYRMAWAMAPSAEYEGCMCRVRA